MKKNKRFTIVELIIVMAIIGVLTLIAVPMYTKYIEQARKTSELSNARTLYTVALTSIVSDTRNGDISTDWEDSTFDSLQNDINESTNISEEIKLKTYATFSSVIYFMNHNDDGAWIVCYGISDDGSVIDPNADIYIIAPTGTIYVNGTKEVDINNTESDI